MSTFVWPHPEEALLSQLEQRILWLATYMVHHANFVRPNNDGVKVGGHQSSSASVVTILTALYFDFLNPGDRVSIKPHASPVFHAIQYLLGNLDGKYLTSLREFGGLQSYPSRTKDPDPVDFSTGSVGIGSVAPNFAALAEVFLRDHGMRDESLKPRFVSLVGDAELDEGTIWEAVAEPAMRNIDSILWIVDLNRQSLDRVIPGIRVRCWKEMFAANGWKVIEVKYGRRLEAAFALPGGELFRSTIDELSNSAYQRLLRLRPPTLREWLPKVSRYGNDLARFLARWNDLELSELFGNLGGHDFAALRAALRQTDGAAGPCVVFAYTLKGWGLPGVGHSQNHSALLSASEIEELKRRLGIAPGEEWSAFEPRSDLGRLCSETGARLRQTPRKMPMPAWEMPTSAGVVHAGIRSTQQQFGLILTSLARECPEVAKRIVTLSPDVATSTNLGGWINKSGVWQRLTDPEALPPETDKSAIVWSESPRGQHLELGISENNLFMALGQFGLTQELFGELLLPIGTLYDPFVRRGLDAFFYGIYAGAKFMVVGTPSGITLASEGGAHQSLGCQSIGTEMPELDAYEPCFGQELEWIFMHALSQVCHRRHSTYLRLSTLPVDQAIFPTSQDPERLRQNVIRGAYRLVDRSSESAYQPGQNTVNLFACGAVVPEAVAASEALFKEGIQVNVFNITGPGPLYRDFQAARVGQGASEESHLEGLVSPAERLAPVVTVVDDHPHALAWVGGALGTQVHPLGVSKFGQSGSRADLYREYGLDRAHITQACRFTLRRPRRAAAPSGT